MSSLNVLLERLRRLRPPPGAPAGVLAVPSAGEDVSDEVAFLFEELDAVQARARGMRAAAQAEAATVEAEGRAERARILEAAGEQAERVAAQLLNERRAACEREAAALLAEAQREAARVLARGEETTPMLVAEVVGRIREQAS